MLVIQESLLWRLCLALAASYTDLVRGRHFFLLTLLYRIKNRL